VRVKMKSEPPSTTDVGEREERRGVGFCTSRLNSRARERGGTSWSFTVTLKGYVPAVVGVPSRMPALLKDILAGRLPPLKVQAGVPTAPIAENVVGV